MTTAPFDTLSIIDQRKAIAHDVLAQLAAQTIVARTGVFLLLEKPLRSVLDRDNMTLRQLYQQHRSITKRPCVACALGAIMTAQLNVNGDCPLSEVYTDESHSGSDNVSIFPCTSSWGVMSSTRFSPFLIRYFSSKQLQLIEIAFECGNGTFNVSPVILVNAGEDEWEEQLRKETITLTKEQVLAAVAFTRDMEPTARLTTIMESIIANPEGLFVP